jgi:hypothetical protein
MILMAGRSILLWPLASFGLKPFQLRRAFDRGEVRALLRRERAAFREMINSGNELALRSIRNTAANSMAQIAAIRSLEDLQGREVAQSGPMQTAGIVIRIVGPEPIEPKPVAPMIEHDVDQDQRD